MGHVEYHRSGVEKQVIACLTSKLALDPGDLRPYILAELTTTAWSIAGRAWVQADGDGGRAALIDRLHHAFTAIPTALELTPGSATQR